MNVLFWVSNSSDPSARFRFLQFVEPMRARGINVDVNILDPPRNYVFKAPGRFLKIIEGYIILLKRIVQVLKMCEKAHKYDIIYTNKDLVPNLGILWLEFYLSKKNKNLIFDIDDAIYLGQRGEKLNKILPYYKAVIAGSPVLSEYIYKTYGFKEFYIPMAVNTDFYKPLEKRREGKLRIGWSGSHHTNVYALPLLEKILQKLAEIVEFEFIVISNLNPNLNWRGVDTKFIEWTSKTEVEGLQLFDIGLMPLKDGEFEKGKCALKAVQYMAVGIPALVSPVGVNEMIIEHGINGYHCKNDEEFVKYLHILALNDELRMQMGRNAVKSVTEKYSIDVLCERYVQVFEEVSNENYTTMIK